MIDLCNEQATGMRVYVVVVERNKLPNLCIFFDLTDLEVSINNMKCISSSIAGRVHKNFNSLAIL